MILHYDDWVLKLDLRRDGCCCPCARVGRCPELFMRRGAPPSQITQPNTLQLKTPFVTMQHLDLHWNERKLICIHSRWWWYSGRHWIIILLYIFLTPTPWISMQTPANWAILCPFIDKSVVQKNGFHLRLIFNAQISWNWINTIIKWRRGRKGRETENLMKKVFWFWGRGRRRRSRPASSVGSR